MSIKNGDLPAMPLERGAEIGSSFNAAETYGLTKREQFAMVMAQGLCASGDYTSFTAVATDAVVAADALLAELERTK